MGRQISSWFVSLADPSINFALVDDLGMFVITHVWQCYVQGLSGLFIPYLCEPFIAWNTLMFACANHSSHISLDRLCSFLRHYDFLCDFSHFLRLVWKVWLDESLKVILLPKNGLSLSLFLLNQMVSKFVSCLPMHIVHRLRLLLYHIRLFSNMRVGSYWLTVFSMLCKVIQRGLPSVPS